MSKKIYIEKSIEEIKPYENNPRIITDEAVTAVVESIRANGERDPIEIDEDNIILSGHTRLEALKRLGIKKTKVIQYTDMDEAQKRAYRIAANKTAEKSSWDESKLAIELEALEKNISNLDISLDSLGGFTGLENSEIDSIQSGFELKDKEKEIDEDSIKTEHRCSRCGYEW